MANLVTGKGVDVSVHLGHEANRKTFARETRVNRRRCTLLPDNGSNREQHKGFGRKDVAQNTTIKIHHPVETLRHLWEQTRQAIAFSPPPNVWLSKNLYLLIVHRLKSVVRHYLPCHPLSFRPCPVLLLLPLNDQPNALGIC